MDVLKEVLTAADGWMHSLERQVVNRYGSKR